MQNFANAKFHENKPSRNSKKTLLCTDKGKTYALVMNFWRRKYVAKISGSTVSRNPLRMTSSEPYYGETLIKVIACYIIKCNNVDLRPADIHVFVPI